MIPVSLRYRLLLLTLLPAGLLTILIAAYFTVAGYRSLDRELRARGMATVRYLAPLAEYGVLSGQASALQGPLQAAVQQPAVRAALVVGRNGRILAVSGRVSLSSDLLRSPLREPTLVTEQEEWLGFGAPIVRSVAEVEDLFADGGERARPSEPIGQVFIELDTEGLREAQVALLQRGLLILAVGLTLASLLARAVSDRVARPILRLLEAVRAISGGKQNVRVPAKSHGEFGELERGFNEMARHIDTAHAQMQERIELATADLVYQARHDPLTELVNRREFEARLTKAIELAKTGGGDSVVFFIDLDRFKNVNDTAGHVAGDELLRQISRQLSGRLRERDTLARIGGDEFGVLLPGLSLTDAKGVAEDLCKLVERYRLPWNGEVFTVGASIGLVVVNADIDGVSDVLQAGDAACYAAKSQGRNRVVIHHRRLEETSGRGEGIRIHKRIREALQQEKLAWEATTILPIGASIDSPLLADLRVVLDDSETHTLRGGLLEDLAERYGLSAEIDAYGIETAGRALRQGREAPVLPILMLPLSSASLCDSGTAQRLADCLVKAKVPATGLCVVLGEEAVIRNLAEAEYLSRGLHELGISIALGEFGGWMTSFNHLHVVRPRYVRIKSTLTRDLVFGQSTAVMLRAVQEIASDLGVETIAEGIDDVRTLSAVRQLGIDFGQGKLLAPPIPLTEWIDHAVRGCAR